MANLLIDDNALNIETELFSNGKKILDVDEASEKEFIECVLSENIYTEQPLAIFLDSYDSTKKQLIGKKVDLLTEDLLLGILLPGSYSINDKVNLMSKGFFEDESLVGVSLDDPIYIDIDSKLSTIYSNVKIGNIVLASPPTLYTNIGKETSDNDLGKIQLSFMEGSPFLSTSLTKLNFAYQTNARTLMAPGISFPNNIGAAAVNTNTGRIVIFNSDSDVQNYSDDNGETWSDNTINYPAGGRVVSVEFVGSEFIAVNSTNICTSPDGITWTINALPISIQGSGVKHAYYANGIYVVSNDVVGFGLATSVDLMSWNLPSVTYGYSKALYVNGRWMALNTSDSSSFIAYSADNFSTSTIGTNPVAGVNNSDMCVVGNNILVVKANGTRQLLSNTLSTITTFQATPLTLGSRCAFFNSLGIISGKDSYNKIEFIDIDNEIYWTFTFAIAGGGPIIKTNSNHLLIFSKINTELSVYYKISI